jgi:hypothetical protein
MGDRAPHEDGVEGLIIDQVGDVRTGAGYEGNVFQSPLDDPDPCHRRNRSVIRPCSGLDHHPVAHASLIVIAQPTLVILGDDPTADHIGARFEGHVEGCHGARFD